MFAEPGGAGGPGALAPKDFLFGWRRRRLGRVRELRSGFDLLRCPALVDLDKDDVLELVLSTKNGNLSLSSHPFFVKCSACSCLASVGFPPGSMCFGVKRPTA